MKLAKYQHQYKGFFHVTSVINLKEILKVGKLISRSDLKNTFSDLSNISIISNTNKHIKNKVRMYFNENSPALYRFKEKSDRLVYLIFEYDLIDSYNCYISDGNCASKSTIYTDDLEVAARYDWKTILSTGPIFENIRETVRMRNAELLIEGPVYIFQHLKYIVFNSIDDLELIRKMYPKYQDKMIVDTNLFKI